MKFQIPLKFHAHTAHAIIKRFLITLLSHVFVMPIFASCDEGGVELIDMMSIYCSSSGANYPITHRVKKNRDNIGECNASAEMREKMLLYTYDGLLYERDSESRQFIPLDTRNADCGRRRFVMSKTGELYTTSVLFLKSENGQEQFYTHFSKPKDAIRFTHASFFAGGEVAAAGYISARNGVLTFLNQRTGHYRSSNELFRQAIHELSSRSIFISQLEITPGMLTLKNIRKAGFNLDDHFMFLSRLVNRELIERKTSYPQVRNDILVGQISLKPTKTIWKTAPQIVFPMQK